jgi:hypothetical protein
LTSLLENIQRFGELETEHRELQLDMENRNLMQEEEAEKQDVERRTQSNKFVQEILGNVMRPNTDEMAPQQPDVSQEMAGMV